VANVEQCLALHYPERKLKNKVSGPWPNGYASEMDVTPELDAERANYYQPQVGVLHWIVKIGRVDVITEASTLASLMVMPRKGHLDALLDVFCYVKRRHNSRLIGICLWSMIANTFMMMCLKLSLKETGVTIEISVFGAKFVAMNLRMAPLEAMLLM